MPVVSQQPFDFSAPHGGDSPPPVTFLGDVPELEFERTGRERAPSELWARVWPALAALTMLALVVLVCLLLGYAFGKTVLGA